VALVLVVKLGKALTKNFWLNTNDRGMDIPGLMKYTNLGPLDQHIIYIPIYILGEHPKFAEPDQAFLDKVRRHLKKINPTLNDEISSICVLAVTVTLNRFVILAMLTSHLRLRCRLKACGAFILLTTIPRIGAYPKVLALGKRCPRKQLHD
jgi:hypothetical protein